MDAISLNGYVNFLFLTGTNILHNDYHTATSQTLARQDMTLFLNSLDKICKYLETVGRQQIYQLKDMFWLQIRDYRADWDLEVMQPIAGNYYPACFFNL